MAWLKKILSELPLAPYLHQLNMQTMVFGLFNLLDVGPALCHVLFRWNLPETSDDDMNERA